MERVGFAGFDFVFDLESTGGEETADGVLGLEYAGLMVTGGGVGVVMEGGKGEEVGKGRIDERRGKCFVRIQVFGESILR